MIKALRYLLSPTGSSLYQKGAVFKRSSKSFCEILSHHHIQRGADQGEYIEYVDLSTRKQQKMKLKLNEKLEFVDIDRVTVFLEKIENRKLIVSDSKSDQLEIPIDYVPWLKKYPNFHQIQGYQIQMYLDDQSQFICLSEPTS
jgi:translation elongation factor P/translation initiation factor 5A